MKKIMMIGIVTVLVLSFSSAWASAGSTMSWNFQIFNNPNARQVALNIATAQKELGKVTPEQSSVDRFKESLDRMAMSKAIRDIVYYDPDSDDPGYGFVSVEGGWIYYEWDEIKQAMKIAYWSDGAWTEITIDSNNQPTPPSL